ncbi:MAG: cupin domain-containing protein [Opitutaceae bacterium]|jgi:hypothetical protein|nr:cupin domain-containing protein [Opitutaceae bacterium]
MFTPTLPAGRAGRLIRHHGMTLIPDEGAWFALRHVSAERIAAEALPARFAGGGSRPLGNAIYALITETDFSALHRLRADETWHFYEGAPAELLLLHPDGRDELLIFGPDSLAGQHPQITVPAGVWMGARPLTDKSNGGESYSFFGCTLAPGFDYGDYEPGYRDELAARYPARAALIAALTREPFATRPAGASPTTSPAATPPAPLCSRVITPGEVAALALPGGVSLRELAGRTSAARTESLSVARFRLEAGAGTGSSRYLGADEFFYILAGTGTATLGESRHAVGPGALVVIARGEPHAIVADAAGPLEFLAVIAPAFNPAHYAPE